MFFRANVSEAGLVARSLVAFARLTGQEINYTKSRICFSPNVQDQTREAIVNILGVQVVGFHDRYLGLPAVFHEKKVAPLKYIKERVWAYIHKWKHTWFSAGGKEILIKAVLQAIPNYSMSCFQLPKSLIKDYNRIMARF